MAISPLRSCFVILNLMFEVASSLQKQLQQFNPVSQKINYPQTKNFDLVKVPFAPG
jgi:hypothetical protein